VHHQNNVVAVVSVSALAAGVQPPDAVGQHGPGGGGHPGGGRDLVFAGAQYRAQYSTVQYRAQHCVLFLAASCCGAPFICMPTAGVQPPDALGQHGPGGRGHARERGKIRELLERDFGSVEALAREFSSGGDFPSFGSGWVWLPGELQLPACPSDVTAPVVTSLPLSVLRHLPLSVDVTAPVVMSRCPCGDVTAPVVTSLPLW